VPPVSVADLILGPFRLAWPSWLPVEDRQLLRSAFLGLLLGMLIGAERAWRRKPRGVNRGVIIRTLTFIGGGSALAVAALPEPEVIAGVLTGIGFIGAGLILRGEGEGQGLDLGLGRGQAQGRGQDEVEVTGVSTAAGIFLLAAMGVSIGVGQEWTAGIVAIFVFLILEVEILLDWIVRRRRERPDGRDRRRGRRSG
jgi:putative Mg2+ transporter-C (MgtC) family protein